jgi:hypothetical protein
MLRMAFALVLASVPLIVSAAHAEETPVVVELFTSQGCSSCPPADAVLTDLAQQRADVLPLSFHVTYWNDLGWQDPFSLNEATDRQRYYARQLGDQLYTPQMVVDGVRGFVGSRRAEALAEIASAKSAPVHVPLHLTRDGQGFAITVAGGNGQGQLWLVGYDRAHETHIGRGENGGRTLHESNIVRSFTPVGNWAGTALNLRHDRTAGEAFAVLLQAPDGQILGAARLSDRVAAN